MKNDKFVAYYAAEHEFETFLTFSAACDWLRERYKKDGPEGFAEETIDHKDFIAEVSHRSTYAEKAKRDDFKWDEEAGGYFNEDNEEWPYGDEMESIGDIELEPVKAEAKPMTPGEREEAFKDQLGRIRMMMSFETSCHKRFFSCETSSVSATEIKIRFTPPKYARKKAIELFLKILGATKE